MSKQTTTVTKLPPVKEPKEDVVGLKLRVKELEKEVSTYKSRLDDLRKAKNNLIIKKTTEYVKTDQPATGTRPIELPITKPPPPPPPPPAPVEPVKEEKIAPIVKDTSAQVKKLEKEVESLKQQLDESRSMNAILQAENDEATALLKTYYNKNFSDNKK